MAFEGLDEAQLDRVEIGTGTPRGGGGSWWRAVAILAVGGLLGWAAHAHTSATPGTSVAPDASGGSPLIIGSFQQNLEDPFGPDFVATVTNTTSAPVTILGIAPYGWEGQVSPVEVRAGEAVDVPVDGSLDCLTSQTFRDYTLLRMEAAGRVRVLRLDVQSGTAALDELYRRRCAPDTVRVPQKHDVLGTWVVEDGGPAFTGKLLFRFWSDGRYAMD